MAWHTSNRRKRLPANWAALRRTVLARDGYRCQWWLGERQCRAEATEVHQLNEAGRNFGVEDNRPEVLVSLCSEHHQIATQTYAREQRLAKAAKMAPKHPGVL